MKSCKIEEIVDKKILFSYIPINKFSVQEGKVNEISPSKKFIKISNEWYFLDKIMFLEIFDDTERPSMTFKFKP